MGEDAGKHGQCGLFDRSEIRRPMVRPVMELARRRSKGVEPRAAVFSGDEIADL